MNNIQFITHPTTRYSYTDGTRMALEGGCRWIQLRMKDASDEEIIDTAAQIEPLCRAHGATFIIDDHVELVRQIHADGVHLGQHDMPTDEARRILGKDYIIGGTANTFEQVVQHYLNGCDYVGCGPFRFTTTKKKLAAILGFEGYRSIIQKMKTEDIELPIIAIGGIRYEDIAALLQTGVSGIALSGGILQAENPMLEMKRIMSIQ